jgi:hypothetical protein
VDHLVSNLRGGSEPGKELRANPMQPGDANAGNCAQFVYNNVLVTKRVEFSARMRICFTNRDVRATNPLQRASPRCELFLVRFGAAQLFPVNVHRAIFFVPLGNHRFHPVCRSSRRIAGPALY